MNSLIKTNRLLALVLGAAFAQTASADITVTAATGAAFVLPTFDVSIAYDVVNPNSVLVIGFYVDSGSASFSSVSFGGQAPDGAFTADRAKLFFFKNPTTDAANFIATSGGTQAGSNNGYFLWELAGVDLTAPVISATATSNTGTITTTAANSFVTDLFTFNNSGTGSMPDAISDIVFRAEVDANSALGGGYVAAGDFTAATPGTYNLGWAPTGGGFQYGEIALAFAPAAIPEPGTYALLAGLAAMGGVMIRRRRR